jgi:uncharacterized beta-barrel protein YwiB (DUF1934 family)
MNNCVEIVEINDGSLFNIDENRLILVFSNHLDGVLTTNTITAQPNKMTWVTLGNPYSRQVFIPNDWDMSSFGHSDNNATLDFTNYTKVYEVDVDRNKGRIYMLYEMWKGDTHLGFHSVELEFE